MCKHCFSIFLLFLLILTTTTSVAQSALPELLDERDVLYEKYSYYENQKNSFWGTQSKKDLRKVILILKKIIQKDNEIVLAVKRSGVDERTAIVVESKASNLRVSELETDLQSALNDAIAKQKKANQLSEDYEKVNAQKFQAHTIIAIETLLLVALGFFAYRKLRR